MSFINFNNFFMIVSGDGGHPGIWQLTGTTLLTPSFVA
jgi:hypothetical protein